VCASPSTQTSTANCLHGTQLRRSTRALSRARAHTHTCTPSLSLSLLPCPSICLWRCLSLSHTHIHTHTPIGEMIAWRTAGPERQRLKSLHMHTLSFALSPPPTTPRSPPFLYPSLLVPLSLCLSSSLSLYPSLSLSLIPTHTHIGQVLHMGSSVRGARARTPTCTSTCREQRSARRGSKRDLPPPSATHAQIVGQGVGQFASVRARLCCGYCVRARLCCGQVCVHVFVAGKCARTSLLRVLGHFDKCRSVGLSGQGIQS